MSRDVRFARIREEEYLFLAGVVTSTCRADLLLFTGETDVQEGAGLDEPKDKLLTVLPWPYVGGGEADPRRRRKA